MKKLKHTHESRMIVATINGRLSAHKFMADKLNDKAAALLVAELEQLLLIINEFIEDEND